MKCNKLEFKLTSKKITISKYTLIYIAFFCYKTNAQSLNSGILPRYVFSYEITDSYGIVHALESRLPFYTEQNNNLDFQFERFDIQNFVERKLSSISRLAIGYQYRISGEDLNNHRLIQQYSWNRKNNQFDYSQRIRSDQTISQFEKPEIRLRYRFLIQIPLNGRIINDNEKYISISNELVWAHQSLIHDLENRIVIRFGLYYNKKNKIELMTEWRAEDLYNETIRHQLWFGVTYFFKLYK